ncbi:abortive infection family protein [Amycolatopsis magusensis]|uniref:abortive infection family protein n=1 Tax=Amycolatopsis magusensis TaxID=882444 RepID=UPI00379B6716
MSPATELISSTTRGQFRDLTTGSTHSRISAAFQDEGFAPNPDSSWDDGSVRRTTAQHYLESVNWTDHGHVTRALRAMARLMDELDDQWVEPVRKSLRRDGCRIDDDGTITPPAAPLARIPLGGLRDPDAILDHLHRIHRAGDGDPALVIGSAKELIESTAKTVLIERGQPFDDKNDDMALLIRKAQHALQLHPTSVTPGPDSSDAVKKILGSVSGVALGVNELRNLTGTGHGPGTRRVGLRARHARLAVNAALTWCQLMLDTLTDPDAPWHSRPPA